MSDIGKCLSMPKPHVTVIVDKLIEEDLVERQSDPNDRRIVNILLTQKGVDEFDSIKKDLSENLKIKLSKLSDQEQDILAIASQQMKEILISILSKEQKFQNRQKAVSYTHLRAHETRHDLVCRLLLEKKKKKIIKKTKLA
eukprot:TRINITY_DN1753_c0_g1_i3.p1 TRINITY_DN1753_c0_g1~~TRINITY_DN1753_c0_g1_i3.p1  ORF type:complete len:141 (-),score=20.96 TRINITY_DN1753_c0_g1_i3:12-434(-)